MVNVVEILGVDRIRDLIFNMVAERQQNCLASRSPQIRALSDSGELGLWKISLYPLNFVQSRWALVLSVVKTLLVAKLLY